MKKIILFSFYLIFLLSCNSENKTSTKLPTKKPLNVVYIMADDHAYQAISAYGSKISKLAPTPNIDRIADGGALMDFLNLI